ncbi:MAG: dUTP diphosphatase [Candidatus Puniceispirillaceae bacterium]|jgi:dUTP pyrophosphatase|nr:dUTP diphosphatase [Pseudomonadota bacterium]|tara:strand:+ start:393 stop:836 length:444 start_codon:yes stop_codon:yes gene_type:complete
MSTVTVKFQRHADDVVLPDYATPGAAGMDIAAHLDTAVTLAPFARAAIATGFSMQLPSGYEAQIRPRSGLALKHGVTVANAPGTIDSDYRGEVAVILINLSQQDFTITPGMRIAQMVIAPVTHCRFEDTLQLDMSDRGAGGFGSTGL